MKKRANVIGINPLVDFAFKLLLASPEHWRVTIHFLTGQTRESGQCITTGTLVLLSVERPV